ncbi:pilin [Patescibacteria group bacterium]|nr:pilin [Patescibacteria group bacterium]
MMKRLIKLFLGVVIYFLLFLNNSNKVFAAIVSCSSTIQPTTVTIKVSGVEAFLANNPDLKLSIWIYHVGWGNDWDEVYDESITKSREYPFDRTLSSRRGESWRDGTYKVLIRSMKIKGDLTSISEEASCNFVLGSTYGDVSVADLCCPPGYQDKECGFFDAGIDYNTECCKNTSFGNWDMKPKRLCSEMIEVKPIDPTCQNGEGINTALGCIPTKSPSAFIRYLLNFAIGIGGGIAFLLMIFGGLQIILSGGNPDRIKAGKEMITAALAGLLLIIFSVFILRVIGYDILRLPGFNK